MDETIYLNLETAFQIAKKFPSLEVGFDLVENEDAYQS